MTPERLTELLSEMHPGAVVESVLVTEAKNYGDQMVSTAGRERVSVAYSDGTAAGLPTDLVIKIPRDVDNIMGPFYANETVFYRTIRPELDIEAPRCFGAHYDASTGDLALVLEDLTIRGAHFPNVTEATNVDQLLALLDTLARLHARYWGSPRFVGDLAGLETHLEGGVANLMNNLAPAYIQHEIDTENFKREMVQRLGSSGPELLAGVQAVQRHQSTQAQTLVHGDTHLGNTYRLPDGTGGLLDWQLMVRGSYMHDVHYLIVTALSIADRRAHEGEMLRYYLARLAEAGCVSPPSFDDAWSDYARAIIWGVYIGWLTTPVVNYGWEINVMNHLRLTTAFEDHDTLKLVRAML
jgi:hypothetical protein